MKNRRSLPFCFLLLFLAFFFQTNRIYALEGNKPSPYETELLRRINRYRTENDLNALSFDHILNRLARSHSLYMNKKDILCHDNFEDRFREGGHSSCVENVGWNSPTPGDQLLSWENSKRHNANLLNRKIKCAGIAKVGAYVTFFACD